MPPIATSFQESKEKITPMQKMAIDICQQAINLINTLNDEQYTHLSKVMPHSTIGKHIRHVYDHFRLLYETYNNEQSVERLVDYDKRDRNSPSETDRSIAIKNLSNMQSKISEKSSIPLESKLMLMATIDPSDNTKYPFESSFGRELFYSCIHAIHHFASVKAICIEMSVETPEEFGVAPSTLKASKA